tara:strand:+ start:243 stop:428 length:186 start_codon:yes stop_codon:yes gene_type:complete
VENRIKKLTKEHRMLDTEIKRLYNTTHSDRTLKNLKQQKLHLKDEIVKLTGESNGEKNKSH